MTKREPGFYWIRNIESDRPPNPTVAYWSGSDWEFMGALWILSDDDLDEEGNREMSRYEILERITPP